MRGCKIRAPPDPPLQSFLSLPSGREFQWISQLPLSGVLDQATLRQMTRPRCGVADTDSHATWTERISTLLAGHRAKMRRKKRFAKPGECIEIQPGLGFPSVQKSPGPKKVAELRQRSVSSLGADYWI